MINYCKDIHAGLSITFFNDGVNISPCCLSNKSIRLDREIKFRTLFTELRELNKNNKLDSHACAICLEAEARGEQSKRTGLNQLDSVQSIDLIGPEYLDITLDYTCNSACMTCSPTHSSLWTKYTSSEKKLDNKWASVLETLSNLDLSNLKKIQMMGGEPFMSSNNIKFLTYLDDNYNISNMRIMYHTNGTIIPSTDELTILNKFKLVELYISIDGINASYEYLRFPTKWKDLLSNLELLKNVVPGNTMFKVELTISLLNLHLVNKIKEWFDNSIINANRFDDKSYLVSHLAGGLFSLHNMSLSHKEWLISNHSTSAKYISNNRTNKNQEIVEFINDQDKKRSMDINKWFPEFLSFYK